MVHILYILCYISSVQKNVGRSGRRGERIMHLEALVTWLFVGLAAGGLAGFLIRSGGYGWRADLLLGLGGSLVGTVIFLALALTPEAGWLGMALVAFAGAASVIVGQRWWHTHA
jgi:uncharacterized membrane protein YeaQ/YmgE (transglycosylase-associated protein family)